MIEKALSAGEDYKAADYIEQAAKPRRKEGGPLNDRALTNKSANRATLLK